MYAIFTLLMPFFIWHNYTGCCEMFVQFYNCILWQCFLNLWHAWLAGVCWLSVDHFMVAFLLYLWPLACVLLTNLCIYCFYMPNQFVLKTNNHEDVFITAQFSCRFFSRISNQNRLLPDGVQIQRDDIIVFREPIRVISYFTHCMFI